MAADPQRRRRFVRNAAAYIRQHRFDGLDLDWEYPSQRGGRPVDRENFVALVKELRAEFQPHGLLLTSAIGAAPSVIAAAYDVRTLSLHLDYMHVMCYDYGGAWDRRVTENAPLHGAGALSVQTTIDLLVALGASPAKLVLGVPFYGRTFVTTSAEGEGRLGAAASDVGFRGPYTKENGFLGYNEVCSMLANATSDSASAWHNEYNADTQQALARWHNATSDAWHAVTYDAPRSVATKARYAVRQRLAGVMVWSVDTDDFLGDCPLDGDDANAAFADVFADFRTKHTRRNYVNFPMLRTLNDALMVALDELHEEQQQQQDDAQNEIPHGVHNGAAATGTGIAVPGCCSVLLVLVFLYGRER